MTRRLMVDVSSVVRWTGPPVGIIRVERELALRARERPDTVVGCYDQASGTFRPLRTQWRDLLLGMGATLDNHVPVRQQGVRRLLPSRQPLVAALERVRLTARIPALAQAADLLQRAVLAGRSPQYLIRTAAGQRIAVLADKLAFGDALPLGEDDVVFAAGAHWFHLDLDRIARFKERTGVRWALLCHDVLPAIRPEFFSLEVVAGFAKYWLGAFEMSDLVLFTSRRSETDARAWCAREGVGLTASATLPLGYDLPPPRPLGALPGGLQPGRYALFVSTVEPRKGHATLLQAWTRLLARGLPQRTGFRLVFVGRPGWGVEAVLRGIAEPALAGTLRHLQGVDDEELDALYRGAAFCLYPSAYEGFGLPVIEAFARGKAVLASNGGALPEVVGDLSPVLDPADVEAWAAALAEWIEQPEARAPYEARIAAGFAHPNWSVAAAAILDAAAAA